MKIHHNKTQNTIPFDQLKPGDAFMNQYEQVHMKIECLCGQNCVNLSNGKLYKWNEEDQIIPLTNSTLYTNTP